jgi:hypothetical protein
MRRHAIPLVLASALAGALAGCSRGADVRADAPHEHQHMHVDSARPLAQAVAAFRARLGPAPTELRGGEASREALVRRFVRALERRDTAAFPAMAITPAEFAWLYYPNDPQSKPPYELEPGLMWFQIQTRNRTGVLRALRDYGGRPLRYAGHRCHEPRMEGENRVWPGCRVTVAGPDGAPVTLRLFGAIVERGGRFKFVSYSNDI